MEEEKEYDQYLHPHLLDLLTDENSDSDSDEIDISQLVEKETKFSFLDVNDQTYCLSSDQLVPNHGKLIADEPSGKADSLDHEYLKLKRYM